MTIDHEKIARQLIDLMDTFVKNDDQKIRTAQAEVTQTFVIFFSTALESATPRPIWQWRNFSRSLLKEMFPEDDADFYRPYIEPQIASPELSVHKIESVIPFLIDQVMDWVRFNHDEHAYQQFASTILDDIYDDELLTTIRSQQLFFD